MKLWRDLSVPVLPCEHDHADGNWEDLLNITTSLPAPPNRIVFSRLAEGSLWAKLLHLGGFDVLMTPIRAGGGVANRLRCLEPLGSAALLQAPLERRKQRAVGECPDFRTNGKVMK